MRLKNLPRAGHWEVDVFYQGSERVLLIVQVNDGAIRYVGHLAENDRLHDGLVQAATQPINGLTVGRPRSLRCRPELYEQLKDSAEAFGVLVVVQQSLTQIDKTVHRLSALRPSEFWASGGAQGGGLGPDLAEPEFLEGVDCQVFTVDHLHDGGVTPAFVLKMAKQDARRLSKRLGPVDGLSFEFFGPDEVTVVVWRGDSRIGPLVTLSAVNEMIQKWSGGGRGEFIISAGGAKRPGVYPKNFVAAHGIVVRNPIKSSALVFPPLPAAKWLEEVDWTADPKTWPKVSRVLLDFGQVLEVDQLNVDQLGPAVKYLTLVWSAVVLADHWKKPLFLDEIQAKLAADVYGRALVDALIQRKRLHYGQDVRLMMFDRVYRKQGVITLSVSWTLDPGELVGM